MNARLLVLGLLVAPFVLCDPLEFISSGIGTGSRGGDKFANAPFTFTFAPDTNLLTTPPGWSNDISTPRGTEAEFAIQGVGAGWLISEQAVLVNPSEDDVGIRLNAPPDFLTLGNFALGSYALSRGIGPIGGTPSAFGGYLPTSVNNEVLPLSSLRNLPSTAKVGDQVAPEPEPSMVIMVGLAFACIALKGTLGRHPDAH